MIEKNDAEDVVKVLVQNAVPQPSDAVTITTPTAAVECENDENEFNVKRPRAENAFEDALLKYGVVLDQNDRDICEIADRLGAYSIDVIENISRAMPKIYYASRTHSQVTQVVHELSRTRYSPKYSVLGSRKRYCINERCRDVRDRYAYVMYVMTERSKERRGLLGTHC